MSAQIEDKFSPFAKETLAKLIRFQQVCSYRVHFALQLNARLRHRRRYGQLSGLLTLSCQKAKHAGTPLSQLLRT